MIFFPPKSEEQDVEALIRYDDRHFYLASTNGTKISTYVSKPLNGVTKYLIWAHGNAMCITHFIHYMQYIQNGLNIGYIVFDYQGYGCSDGEPSEEKCYDDIENVVNYAMNNLKINKSDIYLAGASLGTGVVIDYASKNNWQNPIILISPYKTIAKVVVDNPCVRPIDKFRTEAKITNLDCPVKIFHGELDNLIDISHGKHLFHLLKNKSLEPVWIKNANHNDIIQYIGLDDYEKVFNHK